MATFLAVVGGLMLFAFVLATILNFAALKREVKAARTSADVAVEIAKGIVEANEKLWDAIEVVARDADILRASTGDLRTQFDAYVIEVGDTIEYIGTHVRERTQVFQDRIQALEQSLNNCTDAAAARIQALSDELRRTRNECVACVICDAPKPESSTLAPRRTTKKAAKKKARR